MNSEFNNYTLIIDDIIKIISKEKDLNKQLYCIKYLNNILFKVGSLIYKNYSLYDSDEDEDDNNIYNNINILFIEAFNKYIETNEIEPWLNSLYLINKKMQKLNDKKGIIYILFTQQITICIKNNIYFKNDSLNNEAKQIKIKLINLIQNIDKYNNNNNIINDEFLNNIIADYKTKLLEIRKIYKILYSSEEKITKNQEPNPNHNKINNNLKSKYKTELNQNI